MNLNAEIFLRLVRPSWERLHLVAERYATGSDDARDLVQEALLRAWRSFSPGAERTYGRAWLFVILRNVAAEWRRNARRRIRMSPQTDTELTDALPTDLTEPFAPAPNMDEERFREFLDEHLAAALDGLEPIFREVIVMSVAGGLNYREIAEVLDCPMGTVMSRMARGRRMLREQLAEVAVERGWVGGRKQ